MFRSLPLGVACGRGQRGMRICAALTQIAHIPEENRGCSLITLLTRLGLSHP